MKPSLERRKFLRSSGVVMALPMLEAVPDTARASTAVESAPVKRFVCLSDNYGVYQKAFFPDPSQRGADYQLPETLTALAKHRKDFTVFSNLDHGFTGGHQGVPVNAHVC